MSDATDDGTKSAALAETATPPAPTEALRKVWGWDAIATECGYSVTSARYDARRDYDPLPVEHGHRGVWAYALALRDWIRRQNVPYKVHLRLKASAKAAHAARSQKARETAASQRAAETRQPRTRSR